jgi:hypothetical protein
VDDDRRVVAAGVNGAGDPVDGQAVLLLQVADPLRPDVISVHLAKVTPGTDRTDAENGWLLRLAIANASGVMAISSLRAIPDLPRRVSGGQGLTQ